MFFHKILSLQTPSKQPPLLIRPRLVDTIHNNKNSLATEIIYEVEPGSSQETSIIIGSPSSHQPQQRPPEGGGPTLKNGHKTLLASKDCV